MISDRASYFILFSKTLRHKKQFENVWKQFRFLELGQFRTGRLTYYE